jgi:hypothetical protein
VTTHLDPEQLELAARGEAAHAAHLKECAECRRAVALARGRQRLLKGLTPYTLADVAFRRVEARLEEQVREGLPGATPWWRWLGFGLAAAAATVLAVVVLTREPAGSNVLELPKQPVPLARAAFRPLTIIRATKAQARVGEGEWRAVAAGDVLSAGEALSAEQVTLSDARAEWAVAADGALSLGGAAAITLGAGTASAVIHGTGDDARFELLASTRRVMATAASFQVTHVGAEVVLTVVDGEVEVLDSVTGERRVVKATRAVRWGDGSRLESGIEAKVEFAGGLAVVPPPPWVRFDASSLGAGTVVSLDGVQLGAAPFIELVTSGHRRLALAPPGATPTESWIDLVGDSYLPKVDLPQAVDGPEPDGAALARVMAELKRQTPKLAACYEKWLKANPTASGEVVLELTVTAQGRVKRARLPGGPQAISAASAECLVTTAKTLVLPPLGVEATLEQPLVLRPPGR